MVFSDQNKEQKQEKIVGPPVYLFLKVRRLRNAWIQEKQQKHVPASPLF